MTTCTHAYSSLLTLPAKATKVVDSDDEWAAVFERACAEAPPPRLTLPLELDLPPNLSKGSTQSETQSENS